LYVASLLWGLFSMPYFWSLHPPWLSTLAVTLLLAPAFWVSLWIVSDFTPGMRLWGFWERVVAWTVSLFALPLVGSLVVVARGGFGGGSAAIGLGRR
jgi:hypothetical protein